MTLRTRLLVAFAAIVLVLCGAVLFVVRSQQAFLLEQVDQELRHASPLAFEDFPFDPVDGSLLTPDQAMPPASDGEDPISDLFVAEIREGGRLRFQVRGLLLDDVPDLSGLGRPRAGQQPRELTVPGESGVAEFRMLAVPTPDDGWIITATPLTETNDAIRQLLITLIVAALLVIGVTGMGTWWVIRLGLRPIAAMTTLADAVAAGDRQPRAEIVDQRTEVGRLGRAMNEMLDERDAAENRLRQFVADASHELRTPLTSMGGYLDLVAEGAFSDEQMPDVVRRLRAESRRMNDLVEDLLLLAQLDQGRPLRSDKVDLVEVINDAADDARAVAPSRRIEVVPFALGGLVIKGDDMRLRQVVAGLVRNALVHTGDDTTIKLSVAEAANGAHVVVADNGPGIDPALLPVVFNRFTRADASRSRRGAAGGAGLGLAIGKSIAEAHAGSLSVDSVLGRGTTFTLTLPRSATAASSN